MEFFRIDLHVHTALSACASDDMMPRHIVQMAVLEGIHLLAITDHNSALNCRAVADAAEGLSVKVLAGIEVQTREEVHVLTLFPSPDAVDVWQEQLMRVLPKVPHRPELFGQQLHFEPGDAAPHPHPWLLQQSVEMSLTKVEQVCHSLGGLFIPAHINRQSFGLLGQLGVIPDGLRYDGLEILARKGSELGSYGPRIMNSDAHTLEDLILPSAEQTWLYAEEPTFDELARGLAGVQGRRVVIGRP